MKPLNQIKSKEKKSKKSNIINKKRNDFFTPINNLISQKERKESRIDFTQVMEVNISIIPTDDALIDLHGQIKVIE